MVAPLCAQAPANEAGATLVVYNSSDAESASLARYYAERREIPESNLVGLKCSSQETIDRAEYDSTIARPLRAELEKRGLWRVSGGAVTMGRIRYAVLMRGVPLRIRPADRGEEPPPKNIESRDEASVDSELAVLGLNAPAAGAINNPYYRRYLPAMRMNLPPGFLLVCRLDGPDAVTVRAMIDDAVTVERDGLWGMGYVDLRAERRRGYMDGENWLKEARDAMMKAGMPVVYDNERELFPSAYPVTDAAVYLGWYATNVSGALANPATTLRPGAVAVHIHSFSANTVRNPASRWVGPLLSRGAAVTAGNVYEPFLGLSLNLDIFMDRLLGGMNVADSAYAATPALSWMNVVVGDPLYRPFAAWTRIDLSPPAATIWRKYREVVREHNGDVPAAAEALGELARQTGSEVPLEGLAFAQLQAGEREAALASLQAAADLAQNPAVRFRLAIEQIKLLKRLKRNEDALRVIGRELEASPDDDRRELLLKLREGLLPPAGSD